MFTDDESYEYAESIGSQTCAAAAGVPEAALDVPAPATTERAAVSVRRKGAAFVPGRLITPPRQVDAEALISNEISSVTGLFESVTEEEAWLLLAHFQFNREKLIEAMLSSDEGEVRRKAGVTAGMGPAPPGGAPGADPETFFCGIELESVPYEQGFALPCGHWFSHSAWLRLVQASGVLGTVLNPTSPPRIHCSDVCL